MFNEVFPITSRYHKTETLTMETSDERRVAYLGRRFLPDTKGFVLIQEHTVVAGDRLDNIAARYLGDPLQFWRIADANNAMRPEVLTATVGRLIRITQPDGLPGAPLYAQG